VGSAKMMTDIVERLRLDKLVESDDSRDKLARAGLRGPVPQTVFMFFRFVMPFALFGLGILYFFFLAHFQWSGMMKLAASIASALVGFYLPDIFVANRIARNRS
jgi:tight adherence protein C